MHTESIVRKEGEGTNTKTRENDLTTAQATTNKHTLPDNENKKSQSNDKKSKHSDSMGIHADCARDNIMRARIETLYSRDTLDRLRTDRRIAGSPTLSLLYHELGANDSMTDVLAVP